MWPFGSPTYIADADSPHQPSREAPSHGRGSDGVWRRSETISTPLPDSSSRQQNAVRLFAVARKAIASQLLGGVTVASGRGIDLVGFPLCRSSRFESLMNSEDTTSARHRAEIAAGDRFEFGKNWQRFLETVDEKSILRAEESLTNKLGLPSLQGRSFLDVGSGSGLFSLAARRLGAEVHSFDYDSESFACTRELRSRYFGDDSQWIVEQGSVLDRPYIEKLGRFGVVYSWGVLHHTGAMWAALENVSIAVEDGGLLFIAIYNDQGKPSRRWTRVKVAYNRLPPSLRFLVLWPGFVVLWWRRLLKDLISLKPLRTWRHELNRGMSPWHDVVDWVGGCTDRAEG